MMSSVVHDAYKIAKIWTFFCMLTFCMLAFVGSILTQKSSYMEMDALGMWILSCLAIIYLSRKETGTITKNQKYLFIFIGLLMCLISFISIPLGLSNPPYSIGELSLLISGIGVIIFALLRFRSLILPVSIPFIAVMGYGGYEAYVRNQDWITAPLIPLITTISFSLLNLLGINTVTKGNIISFMSLTGSPIYLSIVSDCTGIWSLGTFTVAVIIVLSSFPQSISKKSLLLIAIGYLGTFIANITRILTIALAGYFFGPVGVLENVHVHIGWIVFSVWMIIFWYYYFTRQVGISFFKKGIPKDSGNNNN
jgi:exosortase/archaeosortase family protein